jgi:hypothetical protein
MDAREKLIELAELETWRKVERAIDDEAALRARAAMDEKQP